MMLAERVFTMDDQFRFARLSGDRNPMHTDPVAARRTQAGAPVVHGIHLLLWALNECCGNRTIMLGDEIRADFKQFVCVGDGVEAQLAESAEARVKLEVRVGGAVAGRIQIRRMEASGEEELGRAVFASPSMTVRATPRVASCETVAGEVGSVPCLLSEDEAAREWPRLAEAISARRVSALAATSYLVGMECPGLHSIYTSLIARLTDERATTRRLGYRVLSADERFSNARIEVSGCGISGEVEAFFRPQPASQPSMKEVARFVASNGFAGATALVVGGSRGLGELTAKVLAAGGARIVITYANGQDDAERIREEIAKWGGKCQVIRYDAMRPAKEQLAGLTTPPRYLYYFATPSIFQPKRPELDAERQLQFEAVYVDGFRDLVDELRQGSPHLFAFWPSSSALDEDVPGMEAYCAAKLAGEAMCERMNREWSNVTVTSARLPRMATDQTATLALTETADSVRTMLPIIQRVQSAVLVGA